MGKLSRPLEPGVWVRERRVLQIAVIALIEKADYRGFARMIADQKQNPTQNPRSSAQIRGMFSNGPMFRSSR
jgi:hypothetical protein